MSDIDRMQQDAIDRAREMYSRRTPAYNSGGFPSGYNGNIKRRTSSANSRGESFPQKERVTVENNADEVEEKTEQTEKPAESFIDTLFADKERTLIILLLVLLNEEKANTSLMLALLYIIM